MSLRRAVLLAALSVSAALPAAADFVIELRDGRRFVLPFGPDDIARTWFTPETGGGGGRVRQLPPGAPVAAPAGPSRETVGAAPVYRVGPGGDFALPSEAAAAVPDGAVVEIVAGRYRDVARWRQSDLVIRGVGGTPVVDGGGSGYGGKAVWVVSGRRVRVENVEITGAAIPDRNGAAIRAEGGDLTLRRVRVHGNEMGILSSRDFAGTLAIEDSEFFANSVDYRRYDVPPGHNIYVSGADRFVLVGSWIHAPEAGHNVKSRARANEILYNCIEDGDGGGSYAIDIAEGAPTRILGNVLRQGPRAENRTLVSFAAEVPAPPGTSLLVAFNTFENALPSGTFVRIAGPTVARVRNNLFLGGGVPVEGDARLAGNLRFADTRAAGLDPRSFRPLPGSRAVDAAVVAGDETVPDRVHRFPLGTAPRAIRGRGPDVGAYEAGDG